MVLFLLPTETDDGEFTFLLDWTNAKDIPWGVILLFGGGLTIAEGFSETGLAVWIGDGLTALALLWLPIAWGIDVTTVPAEFLEAAGE